MKHLKNFESWFTNIFKSSGDGWEDYYANHIVNKSVSGYNALINAALQGNWKMFKRLFPDYDVNSIYSDDKEESNLLHAVIDGEGGIWEKKKMITVLIEKGIDIYFKNEKGETFYETIKDIKLKNWFDKTYPDIVDKFKRDKERDKYNL